MSNYSNQQASANASSGTFSFKGSFSAFSSSSSSTNGGQHRSSSYSKHVKADPSGATVTTSSSRNGDVPTIEQTRYDAPGNRRVESGQVGGERRRIEDVTDDVNDNDEAYEEKMEDEYAKREGGA